MLVVDTPKISLSIYTRAALVRGPMVVVDSLDQAAGAATEKPTGNVIDHPTTEGARSLDSPDNGKKEELASHDELLSPSQLNNDSRYHQGNISLLDTSYYAPGFIKSYWNIICRLLSMFLNHEILWILI